MKLFFAAQKNKNYCESRSVIFLDETCIHFRRSSPEDTKLTGELTILTEALEWLIKNGYSGQDLGVVGGDTPCELLTGIPVSGDDPGLARLLGKLDFLLAEFFPNSRISRTEFSQLSEVLGLKYL